MGRSQDLYLRAKRLIPGGTQLLSKRAELFLPGLWPAYYSHAKGCRVTDLDGKEYIDMSYMGIGACVLGYADPDVNARVESAVRKGSMTTLNCPEEVELAELLCSVHPFAQMVRYARCGGEAMAVAVRIARARTGKDAVLFCGYHGWHDWYLSANLADDASLDGHLLPGLEPRGVPRALRDTAFPFLYNDTKGFLDLAERMKGKVAAVVMEPIRNFNPDKGFLETIREKTKDMGAVLIFDEVSSAFRISPGGAHLALGAAPDVAVFAKSMSNGFPMAAVIGKADVMDAAQTTFISSTYWTEKIGPAAALATIEKYREHNVHEHMIRAGKRVQDGWKSAAEKAGLSIAVSGMPPLSHFDFREGDPLEMKTLFTQEMLEKGFLATTAFYSSFAHTDAVIDSYVSAAGSVFEKMANALAKGNVRSLLKGEVCHAGFKRLT